MSCHWAQSPHLSAIRKVTKWSHVVFHRVGHVSHEDIGGGEKRSAARK